MAYTGTSIVDYLNSTGADSSYTARSALATKNGIQGYSGTAAQNTQLLGMLNKPAPATTAPTATPAPANMGYTPPLQTGQSAFQPTPTPAPVSAPTPTVNVNVGQPQAPQAATNAPAVAPAGAGQAQLPANGSIVDLLNSTGAASDFASRSELAKQFGVAGYTGTAAQNTDLAKKYLDFYNSKKGTTAPNQNPRQEIQDGIKTPAQEEDPQKAFFDAYGSLNPAAKMLYDQINQVLSPTTTQQTFQEEYKGLLKEAGVENLKTELMNVQNIMDGTDDDIRNEITKAGGFATDSQVAALTATRNKVLLKQANSLEQQLQQKEDYVNNLMNFSKLDRDAVEKQVDQKLNLTEKLYTMNDNIMSAAKDNYKNIIDTVGYGGLAQAFQDSPQMMKQVETLMGLPPGALKNPIFLENENAKNAPASVQEYIYAKQNGYAGTFNQYQNEDANRKRSIAAAGAGGLTPYQASNAVNQIASNFDNEQIVKDYNTVLGTINALKNAGTSPTDDIQRIYAFAKIMDPNSVVREGEYKTVQDYSTALLQRAGISGVRIFDNIGFLTPEARAMMGTTLGHVLESKKGLYDNLQTQYQRQMNDVYQGKPRTLTDYSAAAAPVDEVTQLRAQVKPGELLVSREQKDGRHYFIIKPDELWATDIKL